MYPDHTRRIVQSIRKDYLDENGTLRRVPLNEEAYVNATNALAQAQQEVEAGLLLSLTRQADILDT